MKCFLFCFIAGRLSRRRKHYQSINQPINWLFCILRRIGNIPANYIDWLCDCIVLSPLSRIFHSYGDVTIAGDGVRNVLLWSVFWRAPWNSHNCFQDFRSVNVIITTCLSTRVCRDWVSNARLSACQANTLTICAARHVNLTPPAPPPPWKKISFSLKKDMVIIIKVSGRHGNYTGRQAKNIMSSKLQSRRQKKCVS